LMLHVSKNFQFDLVMPVEISYLLTVPLPYANIPSQQNVAGPTAWS
jgi:hypothetical protein